SLSAWRLPRFGLTGRRRRECSSRQCLGTRRCRETSPSYRQPVHAAGDGIESPTSVVQDDHLKLCQGSARLDLLDLSHAVVVVTWSGEGEQHTSREGSRESDGDQPCAVGGSHPRPTLNQKLGSGEAWRCRDQRAVASTEEPQWNLTTAGARSLEVTGGNQPSSGDGAAIGDGQIFGVVRIVSVRARSNAGDALGDCRCEQ